jgi:hypothetical protein
MTVFTLGVRPESPLAVQRQCACRLSKSVYYLGDNLRIIILS